MKDDDYIATLLGTVVELIDDPTNDKHCAGIVEGALGEMLEDIGRVSYQLAGQPVPEKMRTTGGIHSGLRIKFYDADVAEFFRHAEPIDLSETSINDPFPYYQPDWKPTQRDDDMLTLAVIGAYLDWVVGPDKRDGARRHRACLAEYELAHELWLKASEMREVQDMRATLTGALEARYTRLAEPKPAEPDGLEAMLAQILANAPAPEPEPTPAAESDPDALEAMLAAILATAPEPEPEPVAPVREGRDLHTWSLSERFGVQVADTDSDEAVAAALEAAMRATPMDHTIDAKGLAEARRVAGFSNASLTLAMHRARQQQPTPSGPRCGAYDDVTRATCVVVGEHGTHDNGKGTRWPVEETPYDRSGRMLDAAGQRILDHIAAAPTATDPRCVRCGDHIEHDGSGWQHTDHPQRKHAAQPNAAAEQQTAQPDGLEATLAAVLAAMEEELRASLTEAFGPSVLV